MSETESHAGRGARVATEGPTDEKPTAHAGPSCATCGGQAVGYDAERAINTCRDCAERPDDEAALKLAEHRVERLLADARRDYHRSEGADYFSGRVAALQDVLAVITEEIGDA